MMDISRREARDATRLALQSAAAAAAMFSLMQAAGLPEKFVGVLSAVLVVQPSIGNTVAKGWERFAATLLGCVIGALCLWMLPDGYGTAAALALSMLAINAVAGIRPSWRYGVVAAVALALGSEANVLQTTIDRSLAIGIGVVIGIVVSLIVWPDSASNRALRFLRSALRASASCLQITLEEATGDTDDDAGQARRRYSNAIGNARESASNIRVADREPISRQIEAVERFYGAVLILTRVAEHRDELDPESDALREPIREIRRLSCEIAIAIADGDNGQEQKLEQMRQILRKLRGSVVAADDEPLTHEYRNALVFGLDEIEDSVGELLQQF